MAECKRFIATWKDSDEAAAWYEKSLHAAWHEGASEFADIVHTYQWLNESNIERTPCSDHGSSRAGPQQQGNGTRDLPQCAKIQDAGCANNMQKPWHISSAAAASSHGPSTLKDTIMWPQ